MSTSRRPTRVKICGIKTRAAYEAAFEADWVGFVFFPPSPRAVTPAEAACIIAPDGPKPVGLFVHPTDAEIDAALAALPLAALQLYATPARIAAIRGRIATPVWSAIPVSAPADLPTVAAADRFLIEAKPPPGATRPGGNAARLDWSLLTGWRAPAPWLLAGGLTPETVAEAIAVTEAPAVDVSSGVESAPGRKDPARIRAFVAAAHAA